MFASSFCMGCSALFHLMHVKSEKLAIVLARLDYSGIAILILGSTIPVINYGFACDEVIYKRTIWTTSYTISSIFCFILTLVPDCEKSAYRTAKGIIFLALGLSTIFVFVALAETDSPY